MQIKMRKFLFLALILSLALSGCSLWPESPKTDAGLSNSLNNLYNGGNQEGLESLENILQKQSEIRKFSDYDELAVFLEENGKGDSYSSYATRGNDMKALDDVLFKEEQAIAPVAVEESAEASSITAHGATAEDYSETNIQVEGVDEADIIKNDGQYIYAVVQNSLYIIKAFPPEESEILTKIEFKSRPQDIYINGDNLVVFGADYNMDDREAYKSFRRYYNYTFFKVFDVSDRKNPKELRDLDFEGNYADSRMIGDYVYLVTNYYDYYYMPTEPIVPRVLEDGEVLAQKCVADAKCFAPEVYYFDMPYDSYNFTSVTAINVKNNKEDIKGESYMLSSGQNMYVSEDNFYITYTKYLSEYQLETEVTRELVYPVLSDKNKERIADIEAVSGYVLTDSEKISKIARILERYIMSLTAEEQTELEKNIREKMKEKYNNLAKELEKTVIHKIGIKSGDLEYKTHGEVPGTVLNQFSMDERGGYFRIATTKNQVWSQYIDDEKERESYSNLYVLDESLKIIGSVEELARGERIYSARFMQDRAYLVTFRQTDPLFVIDLKNPRAPEVLGELKIPGYSSYLHPFDNDFLIGLGKETKESEWGGVTTLGLKLSLFDVSNVSDPKEVDTYVMGGAGSDSIALNDHKAFLFSKDKELLTIPVVIREDLDSRGWGKLTFSGAAVFNITKEGFELKGKIDHSDGGKDGSQDCFWGYCYYDNNVLRSLYMDDVLYTFSNKYLKMNSLNDLELIKGLEIKKERLQDDDDFIIIN